MTEEIIPAYKTLVTELVALGHKISVYDGEEFQVSQSLDVASILAAIESVEEAELLIYIPGRAPMWALTSAYGLEPEETVIDYTLGLEQYAASLKFETE